MRCEKGHFVFIGDCPWCLLVQLSYAWELGGGNEKSELESVESDQPAKHRKDARCTEKITYRRKPR